MQFKLCMSMKIRFIIVFLFILNLGFQSLYGQWDAQFSQYWQSKTYYNPSFVGGSQNIDVWGTHRMQWVGARGAPKSTILAADMPLSFLGKSHGVGMLFFNEKIGLFSNTTFAGQYAYQFKFKNNKRLNFGLQLAMTDIEFDATDIIVFNETETGEDLPTGTGDKTFDLSLGVSWVTPLYYVGFSTTHVWEPSFELDENTRSFIGRAYYLVGGGNIKLNNSLLNLQPSFLLKSDAITTQLDVTARIEYNEMFNGGVSWRKGDGFVFLLGIKLKNIEGGYSYDLSTSAIGKASNGSHEFFVRYKIPLKAPKKEGRHKSIRIL